MSATDTTRTLRADARRNRERVLDAARAAFAAFGTDAQMDDVARRAGVGMGTVYRHFPTKETLVLALVEQRFERFAELAREAQAIGDPWGAFEWLMRATVDECEQDRGIQHALMSAETEHCEAAAQRTGLTALMAGLMARAHADGTLRRDFTIDHIPMVMGAISGSLVVPGRDVEMHLQVLLDGLRAR